MFSPMHVVMEVLVALQKVEFGPSPESVTAKAEIEKLRGQVPPPILGHYDRLHVRGKKALALVRENRVCGECHVAIPVGTYLTVLKGLDLQLCGNCGRYLYTETPPAAPAPDAASVPAPPKAKRGRKPKKKTEENAP